MNLRVALWVALLVAIIAWVIPSASIAIAQDAGVTTRAARNQRRARRTTGRRSPAQPEQAAAPEQHGHHEQHGHPEQHGQAGGQRPTPPDETTPVVTDRAAAEVSYRLALNARTARDNVRAREHIAEALRFNPQHAGAHYTLATILRDEGDQQAALREAELAARHQADLPGLGALRGSLLARLGRCPDAIVPLRQAVASDAHDTASYSHLGICLRRANQLNDAISVYLDGLRANPEAGDLMTNLGVLYRQQRNNPEAIRWLEQARTRLPNEATVYFNLAVAYRASSRFADAIPHYERFLQLAGDERDPGALFDLAHCYEQVGRTELAVSAYERFLRFAPDRDARERAEDRLQTLRR